MIKWGKKTTQSNKHIDQIIFVSFMISSLFCLIYLFYQLRNIISFELGKDYYLWFVAALLYFLSHMFRIGRLYFLFFENKINIKKLISTYSVTSLINFVIPFKIGEVFRVYELGKLNKNLYRGLVAVWIERFFDVIVLFAIAILYFSYADDAFLNYISLFIFFIAFIFFSIFFFLEFPYTHKYVNQLIMTESKSTKGLFLLRILETCKQIHMSIKLSIKGRTTILLFLTGVIWGLEVSSISALSKIINVDSLISKLFVVIKQNVFVNYTNLLSNMYSSIALLVLFLFMLPFLYLFISNQIAVTRLKKKIYLFKDYTYRRLDDD